MKYDRRRIVRNVIRDSTALGLPGHDFDHWIRVARNGIKLARLEGVNPVFCELFGLLHDCQRLDDGEDAYHGARAAEYARSIGTIIPLSGRDFEKLTYALTWHDTKIKAPNKQIGCCWDADRLDLTRFGKVPDQARLNTRSAKKAARWLETT